MKNTKTSIICIAAWLLLFQVVSLTGCSHRKSLSKGILVLPSLDAEMTVNKDDSVTLRGAYGMEKDDQAIDIPFTLDETYSLDNYGQFYHMVIDKRQNKYVVAKLFDLPVLCFLDSNNENAVLPSHPIKTTRQQSWQLSYPNWIPVRFVWNPVSLDMTPMNDNAVLPGLTKQFFTPIWITKDEKNNLVVQSKRKAIPVKSLQKMLDKATLFSVNIEDVKQAIQTYNKGNEKEENEPAQ